MAEAVGPSAGKRTSDGGALKVVCLCAAWCGTCRDYRQTFGEVAAAYPQALFRWVDIEDDADALGDLDIEDFPSLLLARHGVVLFFGVLLPHKSHLTRMLDKFLSFTEQEAFDYGNSSAERSAWQSNPDIARLGR